PRPEGPERPVVPPGGAFPVVEPPLLARPERGSTSVTATVVEPRVINLIKVPGSQQVLLKVRVAELNRTGMRQIGADFLARDGTSIVGTQIGGSTVAASSTVAAGGPSKGAASIAASATTTVFGIFNGGDFNVFLSALRRNSLLKILAEPN